MKRRFLLIALTLLVLLGFAATTDTATTTALEWYLHNYAHKHFDGKLTYNSLTKNAGTWTINHPTLRQGDKVIFLADKVTLQVDVAPASLAINVDVHLFSPTITLGDHYQKAIKMARSDSHFPRIIQINQHLIADNGTLLFHDGNTPHAPLAFTIDTTLGKKAHGSAKITPIDHTDITAQLVAKISQEPNGHPLLDVNLDNMPVAPLVAMLRLYLPLLPSLTIHTGDATGVLHLEFPKKHPIEAKGELVVNDLLGTHSSEEFSVKAPEIRLTMATENPEGEQELVPTFGHVEITKGATIHLAKEGEPFWSFNNIVGTFSFKNTEGGDFSFNAASNSHEKQYPLHIEGHMLFGDQEEAKLSFNTSLKKDGATAHDMTARASLRHLAEQWNLGEIEVNGFTHEEFDLLQHLMSKRFPKWNNIAFDEGVFDASIIVYFNQLQPSEVKFEKIQARNVAFSWGPWELQGSAQGVTGWASMDLTDSDPTHTLDADLKISHGTATLPGPRGYPWNFINIDSEFIVRQGILQQSSLQGSFAGMHAKMILDGSKPDNLLKVTMAGSTDDLIPYVSKNLKKTLERNFAGNQVRVEATGTAVASALEVKGNLIFTDKKNDDAPIHFTFSLDRGLHAKKEEMLPHHVVSEYISKASMEAISTLLPNTQESPTKVKGKKRKKNVNPSWNFLGYTVLDGQFEANNLRLDKYLSPFIFAEDQMTLYGTGAFYGIFNLHGAKVDYDAADLVLKNSDFSIEINKICRHSDTCTPTVASHYFDFDEGKGYGTLPIYGGSYFEKNSGLLFTDVDALVFLQNDQAHITDLSTYCNGIHFGGNIDVDWSMPGAGIFDVELNIDEMSGRISQLQDFFTHFNKPFFFLKLPLEGNIALRNKGAHLHFSFEPKDFTLDATIEGAITDGIVNTPGLDMMINDVSLNFSYDHIKSVADFSDLQATLLVGSPNHFEEYVIAGDGIRFTNFANNESHFDVWVADKSRDVLRVVGDTHKDPGQNEEPVIRVEIDKSLTHFGNVYPKEVELILEDAATPQLLHVDFDLSLDALLNDLQRFSRTGLLFLSRSILKELNNIQHAEGALVGSIDYHKSLSTLEYKIHGDQIQIDDHAFQTFELLGNKRGDLWSIEQLQLDNIGLSFDVHKDPNLWNINFLGARLGSSILIGMEGIYIPDEDRLKAKINLCEVDLAALKEWPSLTSFIEEKGLEGYLKGNGSLEVTFDRNLPYWGNISFHGPAVITQGKFSEHSAANIVPSGAIQGVISATVSDGPPTVRVALNDGVYRLLGTEYPLREATVEYGPKAIKFLTKHRQENAILNVTVAAVAPEYTLGQITISEWGPEGSAYSPLNIFWNWAPEYGFSINRVHGHLSGISVDLYKDIAFPVDLFYHHLNGTVSFDLTRASKLLTPKQAEGIAAAQLGQGYALHGRLALDKSLESQGKSLSDKLYFQGELSGSGFTCYGYRLNYMTGQLDYQPNQATITNLSITDACGAISIPTISLMTLADTRWYAQIPLVTVNELRPSAMESLVPSPSGIKKSLTIRLMEIENLHGILGDRNTFQGYGRLHFVNPPKKNFQDTIFSIPADLLTRIGLDLGVLTPVRGNIDFDIRDSRIFLTRFKDVYSKKRMSKFQLANTGYQSFIDLDGNVHVQIKMKQYNLVFKLAELFTVTIGGTVNKPTYSLQKQARDNFNE